MPWIEEVEEFFAKITLFVLLIVPLSLIARIYPFPSGRDGYNKLDGVGWHEEEAEGKKLWFE